MGLFLWYCLFQGYQLFKDWVDLICFIITSYDGAQAGAATEEQLRVQYPRRVVPFYNWLPIKPVYVPKFSEMAILVRRRLADRVSDKTFQISWQFLAVVCSWAGVWDVSIGG